jgi:hypothetical protein
MIEAFLPRDRVYIPELEKWATVTSVRLTTFGTEYLVRYFSDSNPCEVWVYDFEVKKSERVNEHS